MYFQIVKTISTGLHLSTHVLDLWLREPSYDKRPPGGFQGFQEAGYFVRKSAISRFLKPGGLQSKVRHPKAP